MVGQASLFGEIGDCLLRASKLMIIIFFVPFASVPSVPHPIRDARRSGTAPTAIG